MVKKCDWQNENQIVEIMYLPNPFAKQDQFLNRVQLVWIQFSFS